MDVLPQVRERMDNMTAMENKTCDACPHLDECEVFAVSEINGYEAECPARTKERELRKVLHLARELLAKIPVPTEWIVEVGPVLEDITQALKGE